MLQKDELDELATVECSRLYSLEPLGMGTPLIESITSYITRLAAAHHVYPYVLLRGEIAPLVIQQPITNHIMQQTSYLNAATFSNLEEATENWVEALNFLTGRNDLHGLTVSSWKNICNTPTLTRRYKSWCSHCFTVWQQEGKILYEPLLWAFKCVDICLIHQQLLDTTCRNCLKLLPFIKGKGE